MCGCKGGSSGSSIVYTPTPIVQTCEYTLPRLNELLLAVSINEGSIVQSQINTYTINCNMFRNIIIPLFSTYDIPLI